MSTPRVISNSGGRTSGLMTLREMERGLGPEDYVLFCNTGKEDEKTLEFLHRQETELGVPLIWLELCRWNRWKQVSYETASRKGEPFELLIQKRQYLPNGFARFCTQVLKIGVTRDFMRSMGHAYYVDVLGIRADEPARHFKGVGHEDPTHDVAHPLYHAGIRKADVLDFWRAQPFDLQLLGHEGNCDLCFQKGLAKKLDIIRRNPERAQWWIAAEQAVGNQFDKRHSMTDLRQRATSQTTLDFWPAEEEQSLGCFCGD